MNEYFSITANFYTQLKLLIVLKVSPDTKQICSFTGTYVEQTMNCHIRVMTSQCHKRLMFELIHVCQHKCLYCVHRISTNYRQVFQFQPITFEYLCLDQLHSSVCVWTNYIRVFCVWTNRMQVFKISGFAFF